jgi:hypothetical protein
VAKSRDTSIINHNALNYSKPLTTLSTDYPDTASLVKGSKRAFPDYRRDFVTIQSIIRAVANEVRNWFGDEHSATCAYPHILHHRPGVEELR